MATLQKFKLLATQCAVSGGPTQSPATSPVIRLRRRKTLRMLLAGGADTRRRMPRHDRSTEPAGSDRSADPPESTKELRARRKLKDLFVSSPPPPLEDRGCEGRQRLLVEAAGGGNGRQRGGGASLRTLSTAFRHRLLRRAWRPVLVAIPEH